MPLSRGAPWAYPQEPVTPQRGSVPDRSHDLRRCGGKSLLNEGSVLRHAPPVPRGVLDGEDETNRAAVPLLKCLALEHRGTVRCLEVRQPPLDLGVDDLVRTEEDEIGGTSVRIADGDFQGWSERGMRLRNEVLRNSQLTAVAQRRL